MHAVCDLQIASKCGKLWSEALVIGPYNGEFTAVNARKRMQKTVESLFPAEPAEKQDERLLRRNRLHVRSYVARSRQWILNAIGNNGQPPGLPPEPLEFFHFKLRRQMDGSSVLDIRSFDETDPGRFGKPAAPIDQIFDQHAPGCEHIGDACLSRGAGRCPG